MASLTCVTCRIKFIGELDDIEKATELQRAHFQSDWHRYNLKRKTADLPPISADVFDEKVQLLENNSKQDEVAGWHCKACSKKFTSQKTFDNHIISKKHLTMVKEQETMPIKKQTKREEPSEEDMDDLEVEELSDEEWESEPLPIEECLFCEHHSESLEKNLEHMTSKHSFFIPHSDCLVNLEGLMMYLGEKVGQFHVCLWCYCSKFYDVRAIKSHMIDKGHCKISFDDTNPEYAPFYNYDKLPQMFAKQKDELQVVLPSGAVLGHRDLFIYYKQRAKTGSEMAIYSGGSAVKHTKMIGWTGSSGAEAVAKAKLVKLQDRTRSKALLKVGVRANKLQRHYRDQVFGF